MVDLLIPSTVDDLQAFLNDAAKREAVLSNPEAFKEFSRKWAEAALKSDPGLQEQLDLRVKEGVAKFMTDNGYHEVKRLPMDGAEGDAKGKLITRDGKLTNNGFESLAEFLSVSNHRYVNRMGLDERLKLLGESEGGQGGFLVPDEYRAELLRLAIETAVVRPRARVIPMARQTVRIPTVHTTSHATNLFGGVSAVWSNEASDISSTTNEPEFRQVVLDAKKLTGYTVTSLELLTDSIISLEALLMGMFADALAYFEDDAFINGTGAGQPLGIINADALVTQGVEAGQAATTIVWENIVNMYSRMLPQSLGRAVWVAHNDIFPQLATMSLNVGTGGSAIWLTNGVGSAPMTILGRPVIFTEKAQTLGTAGDIFFVDFGYYLIGDRQSLVTSSSEHVRFTQDQIVWKFVQREDGRPWLFSALTPRNGTNTVSPYVNLATRA